MRKYLALTLAALLLLVGCTSGDDGGDGAASPSKDTVTEEAPADPRAPGVTDDAIKVGITFVDLVAIRDFTDLDHGDYEAAYRALIDDLNEAGGVNGRMIEPVFAPINPIGTDAADAACVQLTEDEDVFAVLGFFQADTVLCVNDVHETAVVGGAMSDDRLARSKAPWFTTEPGGDTVHDAIRTLAEEGLLDGKLGVVATTQGEVELREAGEPLLAELGIEPLEVAVIDAPEDDQAAANAAVGVIAERFRSAGVEKVLLYGQAGLPWLNGAAPLDFRPQLLVSEVNSVLGYASDPAKDVTLLDDAVSVSPFQADGASFHPSLVPCFEIIEARTGVKIPTPDEVKAAGDGRELFVAPFTACRTMALFRAILEAAGDELDYGTFRAAGEGLGELDVPGYPDPFTYGPPPSADGDMPLYVYQWSPAERDFARRD